VSIARATARGDRVQVPYEKQLVKDAPNMDPDGHLSEQEEQELWRHYGLEYGTAPDDDREVAAAGTAAGKTADDAMTRSEEELQVGTETRERGRARLRKYVVTEEQQVTVPVQREEVRVEREPITDANLDVATSGPDITEAEHDVVLREEEPVVEKRVVPRERVRLGTETVTDERQVTEGVRKEQVEVQGDQPADRDDRR
jgi:uncharacterized protein (TIGR02271 family)